MNEMHRALSFHAVTSANCFRNVLWDERNAQSFELSRQVYTQSFELSRQVYARSFELSRKVYAQSCFIKFNLQ